MSNIAIVYGSLREGMYNFTAFTNMFGEGYKKLGSGTVKGYKLYSFGAYPFIQEDNGFIVVDVFECSDKCKEAIDGMEYGAGYSSEEVTVETENGEFTGTIYTMNDIDPSNYPHVEDGDWVKFKS